MPKAPLVREHAGAGRREGTMVQRTLTLGAALEAFICEQVLSFSATPWRAVQVAAREALRKANG
jgi:hypothetical protein